MTTKNRKTETTNQAVEATSTEQTAQLTTETVEQQMLKVGRLLKEACERGDTDAFSELTKQAQTLAKQIGKAGKQKVKTPCAKAGCKLFACEGGKGFCSNHRPLNNDELDFAATLAQEMNGESLINLLGDQRIRMMFRNQQQKG